MNGSQQAALLQRLYDAQKQQRSVRNQIDLAATELAGTDTRLRTAKSAVATARADRDRAARELQSSIVTIYKSGTAYPLYDAMVTGPDGPVRDTTRSRLATLRDATELFDGATQELARVVDSRDALRADLTELRTTLRTLDRKVTKLHRESSASLMGVTPLPELATGGARLLWPVAGPVTSGYGNRFDPYYRSWQLHAGLDIAAPYGAGVRAAAAGRVVQAGWNGGYGNYICLAHGEIRGQQLTTCYAHLSRILVTYGDTVSRGAIIGQVGSTGASTGPHLHFEVRLGGRPSDPRAWL